MRAEVKYVVGFVKNTIFIELVLVMARIRALLLFSGIC